MKRNLLFYSREVILSSTKRPTIHDVARRAGVSAATVSKILNGVKTVKRSNVDRVRTVIHELDYRADPVASQLRQGQRRLIAAIVPDLENSFFGALVSGIEEAAEDAGYKVIFGTSRENEEREIEIIQRMNDWRVAGAIVVPVQSDRGRGAARLEELGMRSVLVDRVSASRRFDTVAADNYRASADVADLVASQAHKHVLLHCASITSQAVKTRINGFCDRMAEIASDVQIDTLLMDETALKQRDVLAKYFDKQDKIKPTAVFALTQHSTLVTLSELRRRKIAVPHEVALIGFDDAEWMQTTWPSITAVAQPIEAMAKQAVATLISRLTEEREKFPVQHLERCALQIRESTQLNDAGNTEQHLANG